MQWKVLLACVVLGLPGVSRAAEETYQFRSMEDPSTPADASVCAAAPFRYNVLLGASVWSTETREKDGKVVDSKVRRIGTATACVQLTNFGFPPGLQQKFYVKFNLPSGAYTALGTCTLISNTVPKSGLVLAGCALKVLSGPPGTLGGDATSSSVFNPFRLTGFNTGSSWTLHLYTSAPAEGADDDQQDHTHHDHDMDLVDDPRSDADIASPPE
jgi:hypothetical protein